MKLDEIDKMLKDKNINPKLKEALQKRKEVLTNNKPVKK